MGSPTCSKLTGLCQKPIFSGETNLESKLYWTFIKCFKSLDTSPIRVSVKYPKSISIRYVKQIELSVLHRFGYFTNTYWRSIQEYRYRIRIQIREAN
ncbi:hypothetical protein GmHk_13G036782 [Glycine max]|nr:hypothetical protein GmHk_13G036782 [Glycine max]